MKRAIYAAMFALGLSLGVGCQTTGGCGAGTCGDCQGCDAGCESGGGYAGGDCASGDCESGCHPRLRSLRNQMEGGGDQWQSAGMPSAAITYPYYTTKGPRDYFEPNPPSIGL